MSKRGSKSAFNFTGVKWSSDLKGGRLKLKDGLRIKAPGDKKGFRLDFMDTLSRFNYNILSKLEVEKIKMAFKNSTKKEKLLLTEELKRYFEMTIDNTTRPPLTTYLKKLLES